MKEYCLDTSALTEPLQRTPEDLYPTLWGEVKNILASGRVAITKEIYDEMEVIDGTIGQFVKDHRDELLLEVGGNWNWRSYRDEAVQLQQTFADFISENHNNRKGTVGIVDMSVLALASSLSLPLINMEVEIQPSPNKKRIPNVCNDIGVPSLTFNDFLRAESISI